MDSWEASRLVTRKTIPCFRSLEFSSPYPIFHRGERTWKGDNNWLCLHEGAKYNPKNKDFREVPGWWIHLCVSSMMHFNSTGKDTPALGTLPDLTLYVSSFSYSPASFTISFKKLLHVKWFSEEGISGTSDLLPFGQKHRWQHARDIGGGMGAVLHHWS